MNAPNLPITLTAAAADAQRRALVDCALRAALRVLPIFEATLPGDTRHRAALAAVEAWLAGGPYPTLGLFGTVETAAQDAMDGSGPGPRSWAHIAICATLQASYSAADAHDDSCVERVCRALDHACKAAPHRGAEFAMQRADFEDAARKWLSPFASFGVTLPIAQLPLT